MDDRRMERGLFLANCPGSVTRIEGNTFTVRSENHLGLYRVSIVGGEGACECQDYKMRKAMCKHLFAVRFYTKADKPPSTFFESRVRDELKGQESELPGDAVKTGRSLPQREKPEIEKSVNEYSPPPNAEDRISRGIEIARSSAITRMPDGSFRVPSQSNPSAFREVRFISNKWMCSCPDFQNRAIERCKHIVAVTSSLIETYFKDGVEPTQITGGPRSCPNCGSLNVRNNGHTSKNKQLLYCRDCGKYFREPSLWKRARFDPAVVTAVLDLYCGNPSLRYVSQFLWRNMGIKVSHQTLWKWMAKWIRILDDFCMALKPAQSGVWHVDEMEVKVKGGIPSTHGTGQWMWQWNVIDKGTKFLLASALTRTKTEVDAMHVLKAAKEVAKETPKAIVHDKLASYPRGIERAFVLDDNPPIDIAVRGGANGGRRDGNQQAERINNTFRERDKVRRGLKTAETPLIKLQKVFYNFVRPHMSLNGKTPAEAAGLKVANGRNKLLTLLTNALMFEHLATSPLPVPPF